MTSEPFFLLWTLDAAEVVVIEKRPELITERQEEGQHLRSLIPEAFEGRTINFVLANMTELTEEQIPSDYFDLAFCRRVLYDVFLDDLPQLPGPGFEVDLDNINAQDIERALRKLQSGIQQMGRIVRVRGRVIALERIALELAGDPINIGPLFESVGLVKDALEGLPEDQEEDFYCYVKPATA